MYQKWSYFVFDGSMEAISVGELITGIHIVELLKSVNNTAININLPFCDALRTQKQARAG